MGITNNRDSTRTLTFTYDQVNRIVTAAASTYSQSSAHCWGETYTYDQWANMSTIGAISSSYTGCTQDNLSVSVTTNNQLSSTGFSYDAAGNMTGDNTYTYGYKAESEIKSAAGVNYTYDGDGNRLEKSNGKLYWYGAGTEILDESDGSGNFTNEYVFFGGRRIAIRNVSSGTIDYYEEDMLGSSRTMVQAGGTSVCFDADFLPFGYEKDVTTTCTQNYKFEGKERDTETLNDDFGARYYTFRLGRWLSADWSSVPAPVPYANLTNPQTLNLYAMVSDNPESFADLDGHTACEAAGGTLPQGKCSPDSILASLEGEGFSFDENTGIRDWYLSEVSAARTQYAAQQAAKQNANKQEKKEKEKKVPPEVVVTPVSDTTHPSQYLPGVEERDIVYVPGTYDGTSFQRDFDASISFSEKTTGGNSTPVIDDKDHPRKGGVEDQIAVRNEHSTFQVTQRFTVNGKSARILRVDAGKVSLARTQTVNATATRIDVTPVP